MRTFFGALGVTASRSSVPLTIRAPIRTPLFRGHTRRAAFELQVSTNLSGELAARNRKGGFQQWWLGVCGAGPSAGPLLRLKNHVEHCGFWQADCHASSDELTGGYLYDFKAL